MCILKNSHESLFVQLQVTPAELHGWYCWNWVLCSYGKLCDVFIEVHKYWQILGLSH